MKSSAPTTKADSPPSPIVVKCARRKDKRLPVSITVVPEADFDASSGVFVDVGYTPEITDATVPPTSRRKVRQYRLAPSSQLEMGTSRSFTAVIRLPTQPDSARHWLVRARFKGAGSDIRSAWMRVV